MPDWPPVTRGRSVWAPGRVSDQSPDRGRNKAYPVAIADDASPIIAAGERGGATGGNGSASVARRPPIAFMVNVIAGAHGPGGP